MKHSEAEPEPYAASVLFGDRIDGARAFTEALVTEGPERGLLGPSELPRIWSRHILNCAALAPALSDGLIADVGSGAGLPGLVLAIACPDARFVLIEPMERRVVWLNEQVGALGLENVEVVRARAEEVDLAEQPRQVTARAVSALRKLIPLVAELVVPGGELLLMKGANAENEIEAAAKVIRRHRLHDVEVITLGADLLPEPTRVVRATVG